MSVVGFDLGNENCLVAVARQRGIDVVLNDESKRETPAIVCFGDKQRFIGTAGAAMTMMNPKNSISQIKRFIGRQFSDPDLQRDLKSLPFSVTEDKDGSPLIHAQYLGEVKTFTATQVLAMVLSDLKVIAEKNLNTAVVDCCIGIPVYFTDLQRRAVLDATTIAGLHPLRLMHETTATALAYGIYKTDLPETDQLNVAFVDIGHASMQVCIAGFKKGQLKILSHAFDRSLGGRDFDDVLFHHFAEKFKVEYKIDVYQNARACLKLRSACEKLKKIHSANPEAPLNIECLMEEKDVRGFIKKDEMEQIGIPILERVRRPLEKALQDAGLSVENVHTVEVVGSGSCVPAIIKILTEFFGKEPRRTMNVSECVARGCALECAILNPTFKVREFKVNESFPFSISLSWKGPAPDSDDGAVGNEQSTLVFPKGNPIPSTKALTFYRSGTFTVDVQYSDVSEWQAPVKISTYTIGPFQATKGKWAKVKVKARLNLHGIVSVESATLLEEEEVVYGAMSPADAPKKKVKKTYIHVSEHVFGAMSPADVQKAVEKEFEMALQDRVMEETKDKKNAVEAYVYEMRNKLNDKYQEFVTDSEKEEFLAKLQETEDWLYEDGEDETKGVYIAKLEELKKHGDPIEVRYKEYSERGSVIDQLVYCVNSYRDAALSNDPKFDHIDLAEKQKVLNVCVEAEAWLRKKKQQQDSLPKFAPLVLLSADVRRKAEAIDRVCRPIMTKPKPAKPATPETPVTPHQGSEQLLLLTQETKDKKNAVEAYVYEMRNKLNDKYQEFVTDSEKEEFLAKLQETEDWLYEDGEDETKGVYIAKLEELKKHGDPIEVRYKEYSERGSVIDQLVYCVNSYRDAALSNDPKFDHIDLAEKQKVLNVCVEAEAWLRKKKQQQDSLPKFAPLVLLSADVRRKAEAIDRVCRPIMTKPKPAKPATPETPVTPHQGSEQLLLLTQETKDKKNAVEAYVYEMRNKLNDKYQEFVTDSEKEEFLAKLQETEDWLYEDGEDETKGVYIAKLEELKKHGDPIEVRYKEYSERGSVIDQLVYCVNSYRDAALSNDPKFDHIDLAEKQKVLNVCVEAEAWLRKKKQQQDSLPKFAPLVLLSADVRRKAEAIDRVCRPIMTKPKPAKPATPKTPVTPHQGSEQQGSPAPNEDTKADNGEVPHSGEEEVDSLKIKESPTSVDASSAHHPSLHQSFMSVQKSMPTKFVCSGSPISSEELALCRSSVVHGLSSFLRKEFQVALSGDFSNLKAWWERKSSILEEVIKDVFMSDAAPLKLKVGDFLIRVDSYLTRREKSTSCIPSPEQIDGLKLKLDASQIRSSSLQDALLSSEAEMKDLDLKISQLQEEKGRLASKIEKLRDDLQGTDENIQKLSAEQEEWKRKETIEVEAIDREREELRCVFLQMVDLEDIVTVLV